VQKLALDSGVTIAVDVAGTGAPLVLLHERFCTHRVFEPLRTALGPGFRIVTPDLRGYGESKPPPRDFPPDYHGRDAQDVAALIGALGVAPAHVVGWGDGGIVAVRLAAHYPDLVASAVALGSPPTVTEETAPLLDMALEDQVIESIITEFFLSVEGNLDAAGRPFKEAWVECIESSLATVYDGRGDFYLQDLPAVRCPLLFIDGSKDPFLTDGLRALRAAAAPAARFELVAGGPHDLLITHAHQVAASIRRFWAEIDAMPS